MEILTDKLEGRIKKHLRTNNFYTLELLRQDVIVQKDQACTNIEENKIVRTRYLESFIQADTCLHRAKKEAMHRKTGRS